MDFLIENWPVWMVTVTLIVAAVIDGLQLKVPNWLTYPLVISGWIYASVAFGLTGLGWSMAGTIVGLALLLPLYSVGGMGAGDVKLLAGVGAWMYAIQDAAQLISNPLTSMLWAFALSVLIGAALAVAMVAWKREFRKHASQFLMIAREILTVKNPTELSQRAAERKSSMLLLPYGIPIAMGTITYFALTGMLV